MTKSRRALPPPKPPTQIGDYFAYTCFNEYHVRLKTGPDYFDGSEHVTVSATLEGAERLAALMNQARDLARDHLVLRRDTPREQVAAYISHFVAEAVDTPHPYFSPTEHAREMLREFGHHDGDLARFFAHLDAAGTPATLSDFAAGAILRKKELAILHDRCREVVRAWRRTFSPSIDGAARAATVLSEADQK